MPSCTTSRKTWMLDRSKAHILYCFFLFCIVLLTKAAKTRIVAVAAAKDARRQRMLIWFAHGEVQTVETELKAYLQAQKATVLPRSEPRVKIPEKETIQGLHKVLIGGLLLGCSDHGSSSKAICFSGSPSSSL